MTSVLSAILIFVVVYTLLRAPDPQGRTPDRRWKH